jgi:hypothetical protein
MTQYMMETPHLPGGFPPIGSPACGLEASYARKLCSRETENARLKKLLVDAMLDNAMLQEIAGKVVAPDKAQSLHCNAALIHGADQIARCAGESISPVHMQLVKP